MNNSYSPDITETKYNDNNVNKFRMVLPPPNVTGSLHIGHALTCSIQDVLVKKKKQEGHDVEWIPGTDHAGIATQSVVERKLTNEGIDPKSLTRYELFCKITEWKEQKESTIIKQLECLNCDLDYKKEQFTMEPHFHKTVNKAFIELYKKGLVYRDNRMVNWCPKLQTVLSNIEVVKETYEKPTRINLPGYEKPISVGWIYEIKYKVVDSDTDTDTNETLVVATTRPETIFGDVALAIHPKDERYTKFHGKKVIHPFNNQHLPIVLDDVLVDMEKGTGVVKVTPAHDENDYECGKRHNLPTVTVIDKEGKMTTECGEAFAGIGRFTARFKVLGELQKINQFVTKKPFTMTLSFCQRSGDLIEPTLMEQWYIDCKGMAEKALKVVKSGEMEIVPSYHKVTWENWLTNIRPWCISRQLVWGHSIPAFHLHKNPNPPKAGYVYMDSTERLVVPTNSTGVDNVDIDEWVVTEDHPYNAILKTYNVSVGDDYTAPQDTDVLDTWFSAGLYPLAIYGWGEGRTDIPQIDVLETGKDIMFFWVARMVMLSIELTGQVPFKKVFLHNMVRDKNGDKMSKSKGNVIDPVDVINGIDQKGLLKRLDEYNLPKTEVSKAVKYVKTNFPTGIPKSGTDALRMGLLSNVGNNSKSDINLDLKEIKRHKLFCNKMWNTVKFAKRYIDQSTRKRYHTSIPIDPHHTWMLQKTSDFMTDVSEAIDEFRFNDCVKAIHEHWYNSLCGTYLELIKYDLRDEMDENKWTKDCKKKFPLKENYKLYKENTKYILKYILVWSLRTIYPFMPYITRYLHNLISTNDITCHDHTPIERHLTREDKSAMEFAQRKIRFKYNQKNNKEIKYTKEEITEFRKLSPLDEHINFMFFSPNKIVQ